MEFAKPAWSADVQRLQPIFAVNCLLDFGPRAIHRGRGTHAVVKDAEKRETSIVHLDSGWVVTWDERSLVVNVRSSDVRSDQY